MSKTHSVFTKAQARHRQSSGSPTYGQAMELRNLLPKLTAKVTGTRPCVVCGTATPTPKARYCAECKREKT